MALLLKSDSVYKGPELASGYSDYIARVEADGGVVFSKPSVSSALIFARSNNLTSDNTFSATSPYWGVKTDESGNLIKLYSLFGERGDIHAISGNFPIETVDGVRGVYQEGRSSDALRTVSTLPNKKDIAIISAHRTVVSSNARTAASLTTLSGGRLLRIVQTSDTAHAYYNDSHSEIDYPLVNSNQVTVLGAVQNLDGEKLTMLHGSDVVAEVDAYRMSVKDDTVLSIGEATSMTGNFLGHTTELWCLYNIKDTKAAQNIGERLVGLYAR